jgi:predicted transcriptional regulator
MSFLIESTSEEAITKGEFKVIKPVDLSDISNPISLKRMLVKSNYIREGITEMIKDINNDISKVEDKYGDVNFVIFRKSGMYLSSSLNKIKGNTLQDLKDAVGTVFNVSSASVRVRENC